MIRHDKKNPITRRDFIKKSAKLAAFSPFVRTAATFTTLDSMSAQGIREKMEMDELAFIPPVSGG